MKILTIKLPEEVELNRVRMLIGATLYEQNILSSGQAANLVGVSRKEFLENVGTLGISVFGETDTDIAAIKNLDI